MSLAHYGLQDVHINTLGPAAPIEQVRWLITQVERLGEIEDAAIVWSKRSGAKIWLVDEEKALMKAISDNPRPY